MRFLALFIVFVCSCVDNPIIDSGNRHDSETNNGTTSNDSDCDGCMSMSNATNNNDDADDIECRSFGFLVSGESCDEPCPPVECGCGGTPVQISHCSASGCLLDVECSAACSANRSNVDACLGVYVLNVPSAFDYATFCASQGNVPQSECMAIAFIDRSLETPGNWFDVPSLCDFDGIVCADGAITELVVVAAADLQLPDVFDRLPKLESLTLENGSGELPPTLFGLGSLESVTVRDGRIALDLARFSDLVSLERLTISNNEQATVFSPSLASLSRLRSLTIVNSKLSGALPSNIGDLTNLESIDLSSNDLGNEIPASLFVIPSLDHVTLNGNNFSGSVSDDVVTLNPTTLLLHNNGCLTASEATSAWLDIQNAEWDCGCTMTCE